MAKFVFAFLFSLLSCGSTMENGYVRVTMNVNPDDVVNFFNNFISCRPLITGKNNTSITLVLRDALTKDNEINSDKNNKQYLKYPNTLLAIKQSITYLGGIAQLSLQDPYKNCPENTRTRILKCVTVFLVILNELDQSEKYDHTKFDSALKAFIREINAIFDILENFDKEPNISIVFSADQVEKTPITNKNEVACTIKTISYKRDDTNLSFAILSEIESEDSDEYVMNSPDKPAKKYIFNDFALDKDKVNLDFIYKGQVYYTGETNSNKELEKKAYTDMSTSEMNLVSCCIMIREDGISLDVEASFKPKQLLVV